MSHLVRATIAFLLLLPAPAAVADGAAETMALCRNAALAAADRHGVPRAVMLAITLVETRTRRDGQTGPWPWTVNVKGKGAWFDNRAAALLHAQTALERGQKSFDVGCFQLNYRWHGENFASLDQMFEPAISGDYAARFLRDLHAEAGSWEKAAGHYHSRTPRHARRYRRAVARTVARLGGRLPAATPAAPTPGSPPAPPPDRVFRVAGTTLAPVTERGNVRTPKTTPGGVRLVILRRANGGLLRRVAPEEDG